MVVDEVQMCLEIQHTAKSWARDRSTEGYATTHQLALDCLSALAMQSTSQHVNYLAPILLRQAPSKEVSCPAHILS